MAMSRTVLIVIVAAVVTGIGAGIYFLSSPKKEQDQHGESPPTIKAEPRKPTIAEIWKLPEMLQAFVKDFKDPESAKFRNVVFVANASSTADFCIFGEVAGKNAYGAYTGYF